MPTYQAQSLLPGKVAGSLPGGQRKRVTFTPENVQHHHRRLKAMLAKQLKIPVCWEHQFEAVPQTPAEWDQLRAKKLRDCFLGYLLDASIDAEGALCLDFLVEDDEDARKVERIKFVSPGIWKDFVAGNDELWPGESIVHLAVTDRPVQHRQRPLERLHLSHGEPGQWLWLAVGDDAMAQDDDDRDRDLDEPDEAEETPVPAGPAAAPAKTATEPEQDLSSEASLVSELSEILSRVANLHVPPVPDLKTFVQHLRTAALTAEKHLSPNVAPQPTGAADEDDEDEDEPFSAGEGGAEEVSQPAMMLSLQQENETLKKQLLVGAHQKIKGRLARLQKLAPDNPAVQGLVAEFGKQEPEPVVLLSLNAQMEVTCANDFLARLQAVELALSSSRQKAKEELNRARVPAPETGSNGTPHLHLSIDGSGRLRGAAPEEPATQSVPGPRPRASQPLNPAIMAALSQGRWKPEATGA